VRRIPLLPFHLTVLVEKRCPMHFRVALSGRIVSTENTELSADLFPPGVPLSLTSHTSVSSPELD
jgi:hypothetical protein